MDILKEWAVMICSVAIGSTFCVFLIPDGKMKKAAEAGIVLIILILVSAPLRNNILPDFEQVFNIENEDSDYEEDVLALYCEYAHGIVSTEIENILDSVCEKESEYEIVLNKNDNNEIILENISVYIEESDADKKSEIVKQIGNMTGIVPEVIVIVEN